MVQRAAAKLERAAPADAGVFGAAYDLLGRRNPDMLWHSEMRPVGSCTEVQAVEGRLGRSISGPDVQGTMLTARYTGDSMQLVPGNSAAAVHARDTAVLMAGGDLCGTPMPTAQLANALGISAKSVNGARARAAPALAAARQQLGSAQFRHFLERCRPRTRRGASEDEVATAVAFWDANTRACPVKKDVVRLYRGRKVVETHAMHFLEMSGVELWQS